MTKHQPRRALKEDETSTGSAAGTATASKPVRVQQTRQPSPPALAVTT